MRFFQHAPAIAPYAAFGAAGYRVKLVGSKTDFEAMLSRARSFAPATELSHEDIERWPTKPLAASLGEPQGRGKFDVICVLARRRHAEASEVSVTLVMAHTLEDHVDFETGDFYERVWVQICIGLNNRLERVYAAIDHIYG